MQHEFEIAFKRPGSFSYIYTIQLNSEQQDEVKSLVECYGKADLVSFLKKFLSLLSEEPKTQEISNFSEEKLREEVQRLLSENSHLKSAKQSIEDQVTKLSESRANVELRDLRNKNQQLSRDLTNERNRNSQYSTYYQDANEYKKLSKNWNELFPQFRTFFELANHISSLKADNEKLQKSKQNSDKRVQGIEQELQETQQKLSLATMRLRGINTHSELGGGGSRSDQLKNEFFHIKMGLFHDASSKVLSGWRDQGSNFTFRSEEFSKIKSILSQRVFGDGMTYFAQDKIKVDTELHLAMDELSSIKDFSPTPAIFQEIQEKVQVWLLRTKGVYHSDEAIGQYIEETNQRINQDLKSIANLETTSEALSEIKKFVETGLKIVRDIVNDANSGELFIPEDGTIFDDNAHDTRDDHPGKIKMTICAGYRIKGTTLVKADVITHEPEPTSPTNPHDSVDTHPNNPQNPELQGRTQESKNPEGDTSKVEETENISKSPLDQGRSIPTKSSSPKTFKGKVTSKTGLMFRYRPQKDAKADLGVNYGDVLDFEGWIIGESWEENFNINKKQDDKWYKYVAEQKSYWLPAFYIEVEEDLPSDLQLTEIPGEQNEA